MRIALLLLAAMGIVTFAFRVTYCAYSYPPIYADEASFYSPALNLAASGTMSTTVHSHFLPFAASSTYWVPPLYLVSLGGWMRVAGATIGSAKAFSVFLVLGSAGVVASMATGWERKIVAAALLLCCPFVLISAATIRMESLALLVGASSYLAVVRVAPAYACGLLSGAALLTHPMAWPNSVMLFVATAFRGRREAATFMLVSTVMVIPYLCYIAVNPDAYIAQMSIQLLRKAGKTWDSLQWSYVFQSVSLAAVALWSIANSRLSRVPRTALYVGVLATAYLSLRSNEFNYHVYLVPLAVGGLVTLAGQPWLRKSKGKILLLMMFIGFAVVNYAKWRGYGFSTDEGYLSLVREATRSYDFSAHRTFVSGHPDFAIFLLESRDDVERMNGVAGRGQDGWGHDFDRWVTVDSGGGLSIDPYPDGDGKDDWALDALFGSDACRYSIRVYRRVIGSHVD